MKEIIENIQMLFDNKEFTLVDELLKGQGLDYNVLDCSRLLTDKTSHNNDDFHYYLDIIVTFNDNKNVTIYRHVDEKGFLIFLIKDGKVSTAEELLEFLKLINVSGLDSSLTNQKSSKWDTHIENVSDNKIVEFILKLTNYNITCGTK